VIPLTARHLRRSAETTRPAPDPHDVSGRQSSIAPLPRAEFSDLTVVMAVSWRRFIGASAGQREHWIDITLLTTNAF
jgi:hypothetical protein